MSSMTAKCNDVDGCWAAVTHLSDNLDHGFPSFPSKFTDIDNILSKNGITKALIRLHVCAG